MSKPIKLTEELKKSAVAEFAEQLSKLKMADGKISYNKNFTYGEDEKAKILFTPMAYSKMIALIMSYDSEVAWHGVGHRVEGSTFLITDILVYPQTVTGGNVEMDTEEYANWIIKNIEDDRFNHIIMQGHSHVNFSTNPSPVDTKHQEDILSQLTDDMYYIFIIWNKKLETFAKIYDLENNTLYENKDVSYGIEGDDTSLSEFIADSKKLVVTKTATTPSYYGGAYGGSGYNGGSTGGSKQKNKAQTSTFGNGYKGRGYDCADDYAVGYMK